MPGWKTAIPTNAPFPLLSPHMWRDESKYRSRVPEGAPFSDADAGALGIIYVLSRRNLFPNELLAPAL
jgi:hypothetical protein